MEKNVGGIERIARLVGGFILVVVGVGVYTGVPQLAVGSTVRTAIVIAAVLAGARLLWTGTTQKCRLNRRLGRNTYRR